jgi:ABC-type ATPase involved in cell division
MFKAFNQVGVTVLIASHDVLAMRRVGARSIALAHGQLA